MTTNYQIRSGTYTIINLFVIVLKDILKKEKRRSRMDKQALIRIVSEGGLTWEEKNPISYVHYSADSTWSKKESNAKNLKEEEKSRKAVQGKH